MHYHLLSSIIITDPIISIELSPYYRLFILLMEFEKILDKAVSSEVSYDRYIKQVLELVRREKDNEPIIKKLILFCKYPFSIKDNQKKKYFCLCLIRDISETIKSNCFEKLLDQIIPIKLLKTITNEIAIINNGTKIKEDQYEFSEKMLKFAIETISFWAKKLSFMSGKSQFSDAYEELKKIKVDLPKNYLFYKSEKIAVGLWEKEENSEQFVKNEEMSPLISELFDKFADCKTLIEQQINEAVINEEEIYLKAIIQKLRDFLFAFFSKYKNLQAETSLDRDVLIVYFHIINILFKRISNKFYIPVQEMITLTKEVFQGNHNADFSSVDRMDMINLAGIHKYNALSVFKRVSFSLFRFTIEYSCNKLNQDRANQPLSKKMYQSMPIKNHHRPRISKKLKKKRILNSDVESLYQSLQQYQMLLINAMKNHQNALKAYKYIKFTFSQEVGESYKSYQSRKEIKLAQKVISSFKSDSRQLIKQAINAQFMVPNFFAQNLTFLRYGKVQMPSQTVNSFLNSYSCLFLPLSTDIKLKEKLNKIYGKEVRIGRIFEIMDSIAGMVSYRHCFANIEQKANNQMICVTGSTQSMHIFEKVDIQKDMLVEGYLNHVGKTSMEIEINVKQQGRLKVSSLFTMIARQASNHLKGYNVPSLDFTHLTQVQQKKALIRNQQAKANVSRRKMEMDESYDRKPPSASEISQIHTLFLQRKNIIFKVSPTKIPISQTIIKNSQVMHTQQRNIHGKIFGGFLIREMIEIGWVTACKYSEQFMVMQDITNIYFKKPVDIGTRLTLKAMVTYIEKNHIMITVQAYTSKFTSKEETLACVMQLISKSSKDLPEVHPESYEQSLQFLSSRKAYQDLFY